MPPQLGDLVVLGGDIELARAFELDVHPVFCNGGFDGVEVLPTQLRETLVLLRQVGFPVVIAVSEAGSAETAIAPRGGPPDRIRLDENDTTIRVPFLGLQCSPQAREPAADDEEVCLAVLGQRRQRLRTDLGVEPERDGRGVGQSGMHVHVTSLSSRCGRCALCEAAGAGRSGTVGRLGEGALQAAMVLMISVALPPALRRTNPTKPSAARVSTNITVDIAATSGRRATRTAEKM